MNDYIYSIVKKEFDASKTWLIYSVWSNKVLVGLEKAWLKLEKDRKTVDEVTSRVHSEMKQRPKKL